MKKLLFILCLSFLAAPVFLAAQADCFIDRPNTVAVLPMVTEDMNCALQEVGIDCPVQTSNEVTIYFSVAAQNADRCDFWCELENPSWSTASEQLNIFNRILDFAEKNAPICDDNGAPMVLTNISVDFNCSATCFFDVELTFACCILPLDCEADFVLEWDFDDCTYHATNASSSSTFVDCGDCENPSGITSVSWRVSSVYTSGPLSSQQTISSGTGFNFDFDLDGVGKFDYISVCLTIEDCNGCRSTVCKRIYFLSPCFGFTGDDPESRSIIETVPEPAKVFPNPTANTINVKFNDDVEFDTDNAVIEMHDLQGRLIKSIKGVSGDLNTFDISDLVNNVYLLTVLVDGKRVHTEKVIVER